MVSQYQLIWLCIINIYLYWTTIVSLKKWNIYLCCLELRLTQIHALIILPLDNYSKVDDARAIFYQMFICVVFLQHELVFFIVSNHVSSSPLCQQQFIFILFFKLLSEFPHEYQEVYGVFE